MRKKDPEISKAHGLWQAQNPLVWAALQPSLRLASQFLSNKTLAPWYIFQALYFHNPTLSNSEFRFDALTCGPRVRIRPRRRGYARQYIFHRRHIVRIISEIQSVLATYKGIEYLSTSPAITRKIRFCFFEDDSSHNGITSRLDSLSGNAPPMTRCKINVRLFKPLLRNDLSSCKCRKVNHWCI